MKAYDNNIIELAEKISSGDRRALAQAITLIESTRDGDGSVAANLLAALHDNPSAKIRIGISGAPGVGKSTFIENFGKYLIGEGYRIAVLAVDPSSSVSGGSILGDKTRMPGLSRDSNAFIRPTPSGGTLGGVARRTRESMILVEGAGYDVVIVETVGVGQSEFAVSDLVDVFILLISPGGGDELQGIKRGIMELADLVIINKADGELLAAAQKAAIEHKSALNLLRPRSSDWRPEVATMSAINQQGLVEIWAAISRFRDTMQDSGYFFRRRQEQARQWLWKEVEQKLLRAFRNCDAVAALIQTLEESVASGATTPNVAADRLLRAFFERD